VEELPRTGREYEGAKAGGWWRRSHLGACETDRFTRARGSLPRIIKLVVAHGPHSPRSYSKLLFKPRLESLRPHQTSFQSCQAAKLPTGLVPSPWLWYPTQDRPGDWPKHDRQRHSSIVLWRGLSVCFCSSCWQFLPIQRFNLKCPIVYKLKVKIK